MIYAKSENLFSKLKITGQVNFDKNTAKYGGAVSVESTDSIISNGVVFKNNNATRGGGAIYSMSNSTLKIDGVSFTDNHADSFGGSIYAENNLTVVKSNFISNDGDDFINYWGGKDFINDSKAKMYLSNNKMTSNNTYDIWIEGYIPVDFKTYLKFENKHVKVNETVNLGVVQMVTVMI